LLIRSEVVRDMTSHFFVSTEMTLPDVANRNSIRRTITTSLVSSTNSGGRSVRNRRKAFVILSFIFLLSGAFTVILGQIDILNEVRDTIWKVVLGLFCFLGLIFESWVIWNVKDRYGTVREFKVFAIVGLILVLITIFFAQLTTQFYGLFINRLCWAVTIWFLIIWLYFYIRGYAVVRIEKSQLKNFELHHVFRRKKAFDSFRKYSKLSLCAENIEFIVDIYTIRKTLPVDP